MTRQGARQIYSSSDSPVGSALHHVAFFPNNFTAEVKMVFELVMGSFQVQVELLWKWRCWHLQGFLGSDPKYQHPSGGSTRVTCSRQVSILTCVSPGACRSSSFQAEVSLV
ncbi:vasoactive intestinal polypeptide receptor 1-like [Crocuta crocuta]